MIRFAPQNSQQTASAPKITPTPPSIGLETPVIDIAPAITEVADGAMLMSDLPEVSGPRPVKPAKARAVRKPKGSHEASVTQLALEA